MTESRIRRSRPTSSDAAISDARDACVPRAPMRIIDGGHQLAPRQPERSIESLSLENQVSRTQSLLAPKAVLARDEGEVTGWHDAQNGRLPPRTEAQRSD